jgi:capsular polysaccharide biosynthesis protein
MQRVMSHHASAAARVYLHLAQRFRPGANTDIALRSIRAPGLYSENSGVRVLRSAIVLSGEWFVIERDRVLCDGFVQTPCPPLSAYVAGHERDGTIALQFDAPLEIPQTEAFLLGGCPNYCHWVMDFLPRLQFYDRRDLPLLINAQPAPFQRESLQLLGIGPDRLVELEYPGAYRVRDLLYPSTCSSVANPRLPFQPHIAAWLRTVYAPWCSRRPPSRRIFISRSGAKEAHDRRLLNDLEIEAVAARHGFEIVACETLSFSEQVKLFSEASVIAGPHGAGFTNMVFAPETARIVELIGPGFEADKHGPSHLYSKLAAVGRQFLTKIVGKTANSSRDAEHPNFETFAIQPADFERVLENL